MKQNYKELVYEMIKHATTTILNSDTPYFKLRDKVFSLLEDGEKYKKENILLKRRLSKYEKRDRVTSTRRCK